MKQELKKLLIRIYPDLHQKAKIQAAKENVTLQSWIMNVIQKGLDNAK